MLQKIFDILVTSLSILLSILIVQQNYLSNLYPAKILDLSAKLFFPCNRNVNCSIIFLIYLCYVMIL